jgi:hypothetical protein
MPLEGNSSDAEQALLADAEEFLQISQARLMREKREEVLEGVYEAARQDPAHAEMMNHLCKARDKLLELCPGVSNEDISTALLASATLLSSESVRYPVPQLSCQSILLVISSLLDQQEG